MRMGGYSSATATGMGGWTSVEKRPGVLTIASAFNTYHFAGYK
ncbi:MAG: hypothetical protein WAU70_06695 [Flavobacteriales bacterium]